MPRSSLTPLPRYNPTPKEGISLARLKQLSALLLVTSSVAFSVFILVAIAHGIPGGVPGLTTVETLLNDIAHKMPSAYSAAVDQIIPLGRQGQTMDLAGLTALSTSLCQVGVDHLKQRITQPAWPHILSS